MEFLFIAVCTGVGFAIGRLYANKRMYEMFGVRSMDALKALADKQAK